LRLDACLLELARDRRGAVRAVAVGGDDLHAARLEHPVRDLADGAPELPAQRPGRHLREHAVLVDEPVEPLRLTQEDRAALRVGEQELVTAAGQRLGGGDERGRGDRAQWAFEQQPRPAAEVQRAQLLVPESERVQRVDLAAGHELDRDAGGVEAGLERDDPRPHER
jgi:hypothetical protein